MKVFVVVVSKMRRQRQQTKSNNWVAPEEANQEERLHEHHCNQIASSPEDYTNMAGDPPSSSRTGIIETL